LGAGDAAALNRIADGVFDHAIAARGLYDTQPAAPSPSSRW
jgi:hypothetical protein